MELNDLVPFRNRRRRATQSTAVSPFDRFHDEVDRLFEDFLPQVSTGDFGVGMLASIDLSETDDALELTADLPGVEEDDIDVVLRNGAVSIRGERKHESEEKQKNFYRSERAYGLFSRTIALPCEVDENGVEANFRKGVLTVRLPKSKSAKEHERKIAIKAA